MEKSIPISQLASPFIARTRARDAYRKLRDYVITDKIELNLDSADLISLSFLDEIILRLKEAEELERVIFLTTNREILDKLKQIACVRKASFLVRTRAGTPAKPIEPQAPEALILRNVNTAT